MDPLHSFNGALILQEECQWSILHSSKTLFEAAALVATGHNPSKKGMKDPPCKKEQPKCNHID
jgi:hypothetical protein